MSGTIRRQSCGRTSASSGPTRTYGAAASSAFRWPYVIEAMAREVIAAMDPLGIRLAYVGGLSIGGWRRRRRSESPP